MFIILQIFFAMRVQVQKISVLPHGRDWNFLGGEGFCKAKNLKKCTALN